MTPQKTKMALKLVDIPDDCLLKIFKYFTVADLNNIAQTCSRCKTIARDAFSLWYKSKCLEIVLEDVTEDKVKHHQQIAAILRNFGDLLTNVKVRFLTCTSAKPYNTFIFNSMVKYCTGPMDRLEIDYCNGLHVTNIINGTALFRNVKELILTKCKSSAVQSHFLADAKQMTRFSVHCFHAIDINSFLVNNYRKLQSLSLTLSSLSHHYWLRDSIAIDIDIADFMMRHSTLTELELCQGGKYDLSSINEHCPMLSKLTIENCEVIEISPIAELANLTVLKLSIDYFDVKILIEVFRALKSAHSLEDLALGEYLDYQMELVTALGRFPNLNQLSIRFNQDLDDDLLLQFQRWTKLRALSIGGKSIESITGNGLVKLVRHLPGLERLSVHPKPMRGLCISRKRFSHTNAGGYSFAHYEEYIIMQLRKSTLLRIGKIYHSRNQKLTIRNYDETSRRNRQKFLKFHEDDRHESVKVISLLIKDQIEHSNSDDDSVVDDNDASFKIRYHSV